MTLSIRTDFPGGNGLLLEAAESAGRLEVRFAAEPRNCPEAMWFHFRLQGAGGRAVRCILANPDQTLGGADWSGNRPVFRRAEEPWSRCGPAVKVETPAGRIEWAWDIPAAEGDVELAHCFPYQEADLEGSLKELSGAVRNTFIGLSQKGRPMSRLYVGTPEASSRKPAAVLLARCHAGETPGSWVLDGALRHLAGRKDLREALAWWAYPFVDIDDVVEGSYGKDPWPHDCNRSWDNMKRAETNAVIPDIRRLAERSAGLFLVDLHAPTHWEKTCYIPCRGWDADSPINPIAARFAEAFRSAVPEELRSPIAHVTPGRGSLSRHAGLGACHWAGEVLGEQGVTLEVSYQGNDRACYWVQDYRRLGAALVETLAAWMRRRRP
jgi:hypothetical protein